jgi:hypothetical protein
VCLARIFHDGFAIALANSVGKDAISTGDLMMCRPHHHCRKAARIATIHQDEEMDMSLDLPREIEQLVHPVENPLPIG